MWELGKILEEIGELRGQAGSECTSEDHYIKKAWEHCLDRVVDIIRKHMNDGWIPVEERLPIPNKEIWVTVKRNGNVFTSTDGMTEKGHFWNYEKENILAWKEKELIPEPYRPERSMN